MGTLTVVISDDLEKRLREHLRRTGRTKRVSLSNIVEKALRIYLDSVEYEQQVFYAEKDGAIVAKAQSLRELADKLKKLNIDPRSVKIYSTKTLREGRKLRLRGNSKALTRSLDEN